MSIGKKRRKIENKSRTGLLSFLYTRIPVAYSFSALLLGGILTFLITKIVFSTTFENHSFPETQNVENSQYEIKRSSSFKFIRPLLSAKPLYEYEGYLGIKKTVSDSIQHYKDQGIISSASIYIRDFDKSNWISVNNNEKYYPGSIMKMPLMMSILKSEELHPGFLNAKKIFNIKFVYDTPVHQSIVSKQIEFGKSYSRRELLEYMIEYSDNNAAQLLVLDVDEKLFQELFKDFELPKLNFHSAGNLLTASECSVFLESLFNSTYLNNTESEYAISLLTKSVFTEGIVRGIPNSKLPIAHKFGESGTTKNKELHESALLYINNQPYLITIMTRGKDYVGYPKLADVIQRIAHIIYTYLAKNISSFKSEIIS